MALDDVGPDNGCMWCAPASSVCGRAWFAIMHLLRRFVPGTHNANTIRSHRPASPGSHVLMTDDASEAEGHPVPLPAGSAVLWHGRTLHYARGNATAAIRRTYIVNCR
jgi:ectoine hydroxylase-related dioxygenase (phytanoyl-CoA dioxygenase family)